MPTAPPAPQPPAQPVAAGPQTNMQDISDHLRISRAPCDMLVVRSKEGRIMKTAPTADELHRYVYNNYLQNWRNIFSYD